MVSKMFEFAIVAIQFVITVTFCNKIMDFVIAVTL